MASILYYSKNTKGETRVVDRSRKCNTMANRKTIYNDIHKHKHKHHTEN